MISAKWDIDLSPLEALEKQSTINRVMRKAINKAARPVLKEARANAAGHVRTGHTLMSLDMKTKTYKNGVVAIIGPRSNYSATIGIFKKGKRKGQAITVRPSWTLHFLERGGKRFAARPILKPALDTQAALYRSTMESVIAKEIPKELAKAAAKSKG